MGENFQEFRKKAREVLNGVSALENEEDWRTLLCGDCPFYHHGEEENEECGSYRLLRTLIEAGVLDMRKALQILEKEG